MNSRVAALFGDQWDDWARSLARLALSTCTEEHRRHAESQASNDAWANRRTAEELAS